jgi:hypothetical protein
MIVFRRCQEYNATYLLKIKVNEALKAKFRSFMELKRNNPTEPFGKVDKSFMSGGNFQSAIPGLKHAHINFNISIVYRIVQTSGITEIYLYGFYTHDELGTGQPPNINKQRSIAQRFKNFKFTEDK